MNLKNVIIRSNETRILRLGDVAEAVLGPENEETVFRGKRGTYDLYGYHSSQPGGNYVAIWMNFIKG